MKKSIITMLLFVILIVSGCSENSYCYIDNGDESYIEFGDILPEEKKDDSGIMYSFVEPYVAFSSIAEMKSDILHGTFSESELKELSRFPRESNGTVKSCSLAKLYEVTVPDTFSLDFIEWTGTRYRFVLKENEGNGMGIVRLISSTEYNDTIEERFLEPNYGYGIFRTESAPEVNGTRYYYTGQSGIRNCILYTVNSGNEILYVRESHPGTSSNIDMMTIYGVENGQHFEIKLNANEDCYFTRPTMDELKAFGIREYVETVTE